VLLAQNPPNITASMVSVIVVFLADRTNGRTYVVSVVTVCGVMYCG